VTKSLKPGGLSQNRESSRSPDPRSTKYRRLSASATNRPRNPASICSGDAAAAHFWLLPPAKWKAFHASFFGLECFPRTYFVVFGVAVNTLSVQPEEIFSAAAGIPPRVAHFLIALARISVHPEGDNLNT
jgi:hypothetical protein